MSTPPAPVTAPETAPTTLPDIAVVVPVHNEAGNIRPLIDEICAALTGRVFEIVYVNDGSTDATANELAATAQDIEQLRVIHHAKACGQSAAVATGVQRAHAPIIATLDGDGQNDPADIPALFETLQGDSAPDFLLVAGQRTKRRDTWIKRFSSKFANGLRARLLGDATPDTGCGLKVFTRAAFLDMPRFDHMHRYLPALMIRRQGRVVSVPVHHRHRAEGTSKYGTLDRALVGIFDLIGVMWLQRRGNRPDVSEDA